MKVEEEFRGRRNQDVPGVVESYRRSVEFSPTRRKIFRAFKMLATTTYATVLNAHYVSSTFTPTRNSSHGAKSHGWKSKDVVPPTNDRLLAFLWRRPRYMRSCTDVGKVLGLRTMRLHREELYTMSLITPIVTTQIRIRVPRDYAWNKFFIGQGLHKFCSAGVHLPSLGCATCASVDCSVWHDLRILDAT